MNTTPQILLAVAKVLVATTLLAVSSWSVANAPTPPMEFTPAEKAYIEKAGPIKQARCQQRQPVLRGPVPDPEVPPVTACQTIL